MKAIAWPEILKACLRVLVLLAFIGPAGLFLTACASVSPSPATVMSDYADDFNSGSPGAKNLWDQVVAAVNSDDFATALDTLERLQSDDSLLPRQRQAVQETETAVKKQLGTSGKPAVPSQ